jgi:ribosome-binding factor A
VNKSTSRTRRVAEQLRRELAALLLQEIKDPRVKMVSLSAVEVSRDLSHAKVFVSVLGDEKAVDDALTGLEHAVGFLRRELGRRMHLRAIPQLHFVHDTSMAEGAHIDELLAQVVPPRSREE